MLRVDMLFRPVSEFARTQWPTLGLSTPLCEESFKASPTPASEWLPVFNAGGIVHLVFAAAASSAHSFEFDGR